VAEKDFDEWVRPEKMTNLGAPPDAP